MRLGKSLIFLMFLDMAVFSLYAAKKFHNVNIGAPKMVSYSQEMDPSGAEKNETFLRVKPILVDGVIKEWSTGQLHNVTDRSFVIQKALRLNDALPAEKADRWIWQRGPWLLVDRISGHITPLHLPNYDPAISRVVWFRDLAAYCGASGNGKQLLAMVAQISGRKPILASPLKALAAEGSRAEECKAPSWTRSPIRITFQAADKEAVGFDLVGNSALLIEEDEEK